MGPITILLGLVLIADGVVGYLATGSEHPTALIPAGFGLVFAVLGALAFQEHLRKHVMHAAAALGMIGFLATAPGVLGTIAYLGGGAVDRPPAQIAKAVMAVACAVFVGLCVKSFVDARRRRRAAEAMAASQS